jgi:hypothetical protein
VCDVFVCVCVCGVCDVCVMCLCVLACLCVCLCVRAYVFSDCIAYLFLLFWKILFMPSFVLFTHAMHKNCVEDSKVSVPPSDIVTF